MAKALMYLMFGCALLALNLVVLHLLDLGLEFSFGVNGALYVGIVLFSAVALHRINEGPDN